MSFSIFWSAARLASAFASCRRPSTALKIVRPTSTIVVPDLAGDDLVHHRRTHQDDLHQVLVLAKERLEARLGLLGGEHVGPVGLAAPLHLAARQALRRVHVEAAGHLVGRQLVPTLAGRLGTDGRSDAHDPASHLIIIVNDAYQVSRASAHQGSASHAARVCQARLLGTASGPVAETERAATRR